MKLPSLRGFSGLAMISLLLAACISLSALAQAKVASDPTGVSNSIGASGNYVINAIKGDVLTYRFTAANPSGPAPGIADFALLVDDSPKTAQFIKIADGDFAMNWTAELPSGYPKKLLQNLAVRYTTPQKTITIQLSQVDVAEWEGEIAMSFILYSDSANSNPTGMGFEIESHINGRRYVDGIGNTMGGIAKFYRGSRNIAVRNEDTHGTIATFQIPVNVKLPLFLTHFTVAGLSLVSTFDAGDYASFPHNSDWWYNTTPYPIRCTWGGVVTNLSVNSMVRQDYGTTWGEAPFVADWWRYGVKRPICETKFRHPQPFTDHFSRAVVSAWSAEPVGSLRAPEIDGYLVWTKLPASITPHLAGTLEFPGAPIHPFAIEKEGTLFLVPSGTYHQILYKVDPAAEQWTDGIKLHLGQTSSQTSPPQEGIGLYESTPSGLVSVSLDAAGDILLSPAQNTTLYRKLTGSDGLPLFLKRTAADQPHTLEIRFLSKFEANKETTVATVNLVPCDITTDWNRDGVVDSKDRGHVTQETPWRFWINDDDDEGETTGTGIPQGENASGTNARNTHVDGLRDLVDFFPLHLDLAYLLTILPETQYRYRLTHPHPSQDSALNVVMAPSLEPSASGDYLKSLDVARSVQGAQCEPIHSTGPLLTHNMLQAAANGKGLLLIEGARVTNDPLNLKIERIADNIVVAQIQFQLAISSVENMFRHKNLRLNASIFELPKESNNPPAPERLDEPANLPDDLCNDDWIVFLHGYNVNGKQARGWHCEAFKRLFWSGSKAKFVGVSWYGDQTQVQAASVTPKYYLNVENALNTAASLSEFVNALDGGKKYLAGHSLGCLVISSAITNEGMNAEKAFMLDPALPTESLLPATTILNDIHMEPSRWRDYPEAIKTSEWYLLFPSTDARSALTWRGRLNSSVPKLKIFFSGGEEVLAALPPNIPADPGWAGDSPRGQYSFAIQAMLKGELGNEPKASEESFMGKLASILAHAWSGYSPASAHGGWRWTMGTAQPYYIIVDAGGGLTWEPPAAFAFRLDDPAFRTRLKTDPVSGLTAPDGCEDLFHPTKGNNIAADAQKARRILAQMIPERTLPAGGAGGSGVAGNNPVASLQQKFEAAQAGVIEVFDMQENRNGWPLSRPAIQPGNGWRHSDIREVAYTHVWKAWQEIVNDSGIDSDP